MRRKVGKCELGGEILAMISDLRLIISCNNKVLRIFLFIFWIDNNVIDFSDCYKFCLDQNFLFLKKILKNNKLEKE